MSKNPPKPSISETRSRPGIAGNVRLAGLVRVCVATPPLSERLTVGIDRVGRGERPNFAASRVDRRRSRLELEVLSGSIAGTDRPHELRVAEDAPTLPAKSPIVGGDDEVGDVVVEEVVLELAKSAAGSGPARLTATCDDAVEDVVHRQDVHDGKRVLVVELQARSSGWRNRRCRTCC